MELKKSSIRWNYRSARTAFSKRDVFSMTQNGQRKRFIVQRSGENGPSVQTVTNKEGQPVAAANGSGLLKKKIYNLQATCEEAAVRLAPLFEDAKAAEIAGNMEQAANLYNAWLNGSAISFNVLSTSRLYDTDLSNAEIEAVLVRVDTENGSLLTIDSSTIRVVPATAGKSGTDFASAFFTERDLIHEPAPKKEELIDVTKVIS